MALQCLGKRNKFQNSSHTKDHCADDPSDLLSRGFKAYLGGASPGVYIGGSVVMELRQVDELRTYQQS